jgi:hypothetical protein
VKQKKKKAHAPRLSKIIIKLMLSMAVAKRNACVGCGMMVRGFVILQLIVLLILSVDGTAEGFEPLCDLHKQDYGLHTPPNTLPQPAKSSWLFASMKDIEKYYIQGKAQCESFLANEKVRKGYIRSDHAPVYPQPITGKGQLKCRGRDTLYSVTGKVLWPFGPGVTDSLSSNSPHSECSTYSKCWFGLLSCGEFKESQTVDISKDEIEKARSRITGKNTTSPGNSMHWSMKSLAMQLRVIGPEIIVPDQRLVNLSVPSQQNEKVLIQDDVIVAQYFVTIPSNNYTIEMRHFEFYPSALLNWKQREFAEYHVENFGMFYLGGSEGRCRPWTRCDLSNICCGCDERSFVLHTPLLLHVSDDGRDRCQNILNVKKPESLPLCTVGQDPTKAAPSGRWIQSNHPYLEKTCKDDNSYNIAKMVVQEKLQHTKEVLEKLAAEDQKDAYLQHGWYEASGNPCMRSDEKEELGNAHWFFAPYTCKYHFYERHEIHQCLRDMKIGHIHFQGDSMSRELFSIVSSYLGVPQVSEANLKHMTNNMQVKDIRFHTGAVVLSEGKADVNLAL